jgi:hypothetical protein
MSVCDCVAALAKETTVHAPGPLTHAGLSFNDGAMPAPQPRNCLLKNCVGRQILSVDDYVGMLSQGVRCRLGRMVACGSKGGRLAWIPAPLEMKPTLTLLNWSCKVNQPSDVDILPEEGRLSDRPYCVHNQETIRLRLQTFQYPVNQPSPPGLVLKLCSEHLKVSASIG